jgi:L-ascorbate metabolism protein UlaG (beta-lactamase superfamily)
MLDWDCRLAHLGALTELLPTEVVEKLGVVDVLFVPVGGGGTLEPKFAAKVVTTLNPKIVIPVDYDDEAQLKTFLKEIGAEGKAPVDHSMICSGLASVNRTLSKSLTFVMFSVDIGFVLV